MPREETFGPYRVGERLGRGGMGVVHRATDTRKPRQVALKRLPADLADDLRFVERFRHEARITVGLNDPHVIPIHEYGEVDGRLYLDMRLVEGADLESIVGERPIPARRAATIVGHVSDALDAAHHAGLVHRDVKPSNILLSRPEYLRDGESRDFAYLIDFGIGANVADSRMTTTGQFVGTFAYMAPERFAAGQRPDPRSDVYALGCVLYQCLAGCPPFRGSNAELMGAHERAAPPRPSAARADLPVALDDVVATAMAKDPGRRFPRAGDLADAVRAALEPAARRRQARKPWDSFGDALRAVVARPAEVPREQHAPPGPRRPVRVPPPVPIRSGGRHRAEDAHVPRAREAPDAEPAAREFSVPVASPEAGTTGHRVVAFAPRGTLLATDSATTTGTHVWDVTGNGTGSTLHHPGSRVADIAFSPDGLHVASALTGRSASGSTTYRAAIATLDGRNATMLGHIGPLTALAYSPDGRRLVTASGDRRITIWSVPTSVSTTARFLAPETVHDVCFSPDAGCLALAGTGVLLRALASSPAPDRRFVSEPDKPVRGLSFSADGRLLAVAGPDRLAVVWDVAAGTEVGRYRHAGDVAAVALSPDGSLLATACSDCFAGLWDVRSGDIVTRYRRTTPVTDVAFDPTGTAIAVASSDHDACVVVRPEG